MCACNFDCLFVMTIKILNFNFILFQFRLHICSFVWCCFISGYKNVSSAKNKKYFRNIMRCFAGIKYVKRNSKHFSNLLFIVDIIFINIIHTNYKQRELRIQIFRGCESGRWHARERERENNIIESIFFFL